MTASRNLVEEQDTICRTCGGANDDGEGWDGKCGNCADKAHNRDLAHEPLALNQFQKAMLETYDNGAFAYLIQEGSVEDPMELGDTLLAFLLIELSDKESCDTADEAKLRLHSANRDIEVALLAIDKLAEAIRLKQGA